jgi:hypothetical protein
VDFALGVALGGLAGVLLERLVGRPFDLYIITPIRHRSRQKHLLEAQREAAVTDELIVLAGTALFVRQFIPGGLELGALTATIDTASWSLSRRVAESPAARRQLLAWGPTELASSIDAWRGRLEKDARRWNGQQLALSQLDVSRHPVSESPIIALTFRESDYANFCALGEIWTAVPIESRRAIDGDAMREVDPLLSASFGLNCTIQTADGKLLVTRRSKLARGWEGLWHTSFNEGLSALDLRPGGYVDILGAFGRGLREELGIDWQQLTDFAERLTIHTLLLDVDNYQWGLLAHLDLRSTDITSTAIRIARNLGAAHDAWEASELRFLPFADAGNAVVDELTRARDWVPHGLLNVALSAVHVQPSKAASIRAALGEH